jgi:glycosyltransferase involved in cell wall biosynthesis
MTDAKVLMSAYACGPGRGSEPGIGWNTAREMATRHDVWLMTSFENRSPIEQELAVRPIPRLRVIFVDWPKALTWMKATRIGYELQHYTWHFLIYVKARRMHRAIGFDLVHHVTIGRYWMPVFLALLPIPFIWGPVGGGESIPTCFWCGLGLKGAATEIVRSWARWLVERDPFVVLTAKRSALALATTDETRERVARLGARSVQVLSQVGLSESELALLERSGSPELPPVRFISIGRLVHWKGFHLGLKAFAGLERDDTEYWFIGTGSALGWLQALARDLGVARRVRFLGALSRDETIARLQQAHVLVHPSLHESGGMVCIEAMAAGKPVICLDLGGPALAVTPETGFKVPVRSPHLTVLDLERAMSRLAASHELRGRMGTAARVRAREFNWRRRGDDLSRLYASVNHGHVSTIG